jgi:hypothetical protein
MDQIAGSDHIRVRQIMAIGVEQRAERLIPVMNEWRSNERDTFVTRTRGARAFRGGMNM